MSNENKAKSIIHKLQALAAKKGIVAQDLRSDFLLERLSARILDEKNLNLATIFKGGFVSRRVYLTNRFTQDLDIATPTIPRDLIVPAITQAVNKDLEDGAWFKVIDQAPLAHQFGEPGIRVRFATGLGEKPKEVKRPFVLGLDISTKPVFESSTISTKTLLDDGSLDWNVSTAESTLSEKLSALLTRVSGNTRARDVYDIMRMTPSCNADRLRLAINDAFQRTNIDVPENIPHSLSRVDKSKLKKAWDEAILYLGPKIEFEAAWNEMLKVLEEKLIEKL